MTSSTLERRTCTGHPIEFRAGPDGKLKAAGYAYVFNSLSQNLGGFVEQIAPGAGAKSIQEQDVRALLNHDPNMLLGRTGNGTMVLGEDGTGGHYEITLPDTAAGRDVAALLERGDLYGSSFGFRTIEDEWGLTDQGFPLRTLKAFALRDVGPVTFPAYLATDAALRHLAEARALPEAEVLAAAARNELRNIIVPPAHVEPEQDRATPILPHARRWAALR